jgi:hypothetical protein
MRALILQPRRNLIVWLIAFVSPVGFFVLLMLGDRLGLASPPEGLVATLFYATPVVALAVCGWAVWGSSLPTGRKVGWAVFTLLGIGLQFGGIIALIIAVTVAISAP